MKSTSGFRTIAIVVVVVAVFIVGAVGYTIVTNSQVAEQQMMEKKVMVEKDSDVMMDKTEEMENEGGVMMDNNSGAMIDKAEEIQKDNMTMDDSMTNKDEAMKKDDAMVNEADSAMLDKAGTYTTYSGDTLAMAQKGRTVLFFHASWCPSCRSVDADITKNLSAIPTGVTILKTDYDTQTALKQKYGVTTQHTFVEVDSSGAMVQKWSGGNFAGIAAKL